MSEPVVTSEREQALLKELRFRTARSGGPGGQHVNKVESQVELRFELGASRILTTEEKELLALRLRPLLAADGTIRLVGREYRSQWRNKQSVVERFLRLLQRSLKPVKKRKPTGPTVASREKRLERKRTRGEVKKSRRLPQE